MPRNGSGVYGSPAGTAAVPNTTIESADYNAVVADMALALTDSVNVQGTAPFQANQPMGGNKLTGLGAGSAASDSANLGQVQSTIVAHAASVGGTADAITATFAPAFTAWTAKIRFRFTAAAANTVGAPTINIDGLGAKIIKKQTGATLAPGEISGAGHICDCVYSGTDVILLNPWVTTFVDKVTFSKPVITSMTTLADAATIAWDMNSAPNDVRIVLSASRNLGLPTNINTGQRGQLVIQQDGTGGWGLTPNAVFDFSGGQTVLDLDKTANAQTVFAYSVIEDHAGAKKIQLERAYATGWDSIGFFKEFDAGLAGSTLIRTVTHGLGRYPSQIMPVMQCLSAEGGYSVGDRIYTLGSGGVDTNDGNGNGYGHCCGASTTEAWILVGLVVVKWKTSPSSNFNPGANWRMFLRVYA